jgi:hypothetical protein
MKRPRIGGRKRGRKLFGKIGHYLLSFSFESTRQTSPPPPLSIFDLQDSICGSACGGVTEAGSKNVCVHLFYLHQKSSSQCVVREGDRESQIAIA